MGDHGSPDIGLVWRCVVVDIQVAGDRDRASTSEYLETHVIALSLLRSLHLNRRYNCRWIIRAINLACEDIAH